MFSKASFFFAALVSALNVAGPAWFSPAAMAGEKIEFSTPTPELSLPKPEREEKDNTQDSSPNHTFSSVNIPGEYIPPPTTIIITTHNRRQGSYGSKDDSKDKSETDTASESSIRATNQWNLERGWDNNSTTGYQYNRSLYGNNSFTGLDHSRPHNFFREERSSFWDRESRDRGGSSVWSQVYGSAGGAALDRVQQTQDREFNAFQSLNSLPNSTSPAGSLAGSTDPLQSSSWDSHFSDNWTHKSDDDSSAAYYHPPISAAASDTQNFGQSYYERSSLSPAQTQFRSTPAVLPFPKKPGDLFK